MSEDKFKNFYRVKSARLPNWDYGSNAIYFVTICTNDRKDFFGNIVETQNFASLQKTIIGELAEKFWFEIPDHFPFITLDQFILMPNHIHGIICINSSEFHTYQPNRFAPQSKNLPSVIRGFKAAVKKFATINNIEFSWQPRYYDRVVRNENELVRIRRYIIDNPSNWQKDKENAENLFM